MTEENKKLVLDARSFNSAERMECQTEFGASFGDLLQCMFEEVRPPEDGHRTRIVDAEGRQRFGDEIIQHMLWVQTKRDQPDTELSEFDGLTFIELTSAHVRGLVGKGNSKSKPKKRSRKQGSASSSAA